MTNHNENSTSTKWHQTTGAFVSLASLSYVFWIYGGMELVERLAYYGVKATTTLYAKDPVLPEVGGINPNEFGTILMVWALLQSLLFLPADFLTDMVTNKPFCFNSIEKNYYLIMGFYATYWVFCRCCSPCHRNSIFNQVYKVPSSNQPTVKQLDGFRCLSNSNIGGWI